MPTHIAAAPALRSSRRAAASLPDRLGPQTPSLFPIPIPHPTLHPPRPTLHDHSPSPSPLSTLQPPLSVRQRRTETVSA